MQPWPPQKMLGCPTWRSYQDPWWAHSYSHRCKSPHWLTWSLSCLGSCWCRRQIWLCLILLKLSQGDSFIAKRISCHKLEWTWTLCRRSSSKIVHKRIRQNTQACRRKIFDHRTCEPMSAQAQAFRQDEVQNKRRAQAEQNKSVPPSFALSILAFHSASGIQQICVPLRLLHCLLHHLALVGTSLPLSESRLCIILAMESSRSVYLCIICCIIWQAFQPFHFVLCKIVSLIQRCPRTYLEKVGAEDHEEENQHQIHQEDEDHEEGGRHEGGRESAATRRSSNSGGHKCRSQQQCQHQHHTRCLSTAQSTTCHQQQNNGNSTCHDVKKLARTHRNYKYSASMHPICSFHAKTMFWLLLRLRIVCKWRLVCVCVWLQLPHLLPFVLCVLPVCVACPFRCV